MMSPTERVEQYFKRKDITIAKIVDFDVAKDCLHIFNFTSTNRGLHPETLADTTCFTDWINNELHSSNCRYGIGGYNEYRTIYARSKHFDAGEEPRRLHLGVDIWGKAGTAVYNFLPATVHSFKYNDQFGDYGATIILQYELDGLTLHALYGHLDLASLNGLHKGQIIDAGQKFACFGTPEENGHWPPHLHFQLIFEMKDFYGDYPGVCQYSQRETFLKNCPDPAPILRYTFQ
jgi:murein DD-endopeptidase MepM/ murein hydrolase activator NlpD